MYSLVSRKSLGPFDNNTNCYRSLLSNRLFETDRNSYLTRRSDMIHDERRRKHDDI